MNNLLCCSPFLQHRVAYFIGVMQGIKMRQKHLQFLTGKALYSSAVTSYPYITICLFFAFLSSPPVDHELRTTWHFWPLSRISKTLLTVLAGSQPLRIKVCNNSLTQNALFSDAEDGDACLLQEAEKMMGQFTQPPLSRATSAPRAAQPVPASVLQGLGCSLGAKPSNQAIWRQTHRLERSLGGHVLPPPCSRLGQLQSQSCVQSSFEYLQEGRFHNLRG